MSQSITCYSQNKNSQADSEKADSIHKVNVSTLAGSSYVTSFTLIRLTKSRGLLAENGEKLHEVSILSSFSTCVNYVFKHGTQVSQRLQNLELQAILLHASGVGLNLELHATHFERSGRGPRPHTLREDKRPLVKVKSRMAELVRTGRSPPCERPIELHVTAFRPYNRN